MEQLSLKQNLSVIQPVLNSFSTLHHLWLKFVSCSGEYIFTPQKNQSRFCQLIRNHPEGLKRCRASALRCTNLTPNRFHLFSCHAGLTILAVPLQSKYGLLGALATGEIRLNSNWHDDSEISRTTRDLNLNSKELAESLNEIALREKDDVMVLANALHTISNCFLNLGISCADLDNKALYTEYRLSGSQLLTRKAATYISENYMKQLSLEEVARHVHLSPAYFSYLFSQEQRHTFSDYLTQVRLEKAKNLLIENPLLSIFEIAQLTGYEDASYFSRVFKKILGIPPSLYRKTCPANEKTVC